MSSDSMNQATPPPSGCFPLGFGYSSSSRQRQQYTPPSPLHLEFTRAQNSAVPGILFQLWRLQSTTYSPQPIFLRCLTLVCVSTADISLCLDLPWIKLTWEQLHSTRLRLQHGFFRHRWPRRAGKRAGKSFNAPESAKFLSQWDWVALCWKLL